MKTNKKLINILLKSFLLIDFAEVGVLHGSDTASNSSEKKTISAADRLKKLTNACNQESPDLDKISEILKGISDINTICDGTHTALHLAARNGHIKVVELLVERKADVNLRASERGRSGSSPLLLAAEKGHKDVVEYLLDHGADINSRYELSGFRAIHWGVKNKDMDMVKLLVDRGADTRPEDFMGWNRPLHYAARQGLKEIAIYILESDKNKEEKDKAVNVENHAGETPLDVAKNEEMKKIFLQYGGKSGRPRPPSQGRPPRPQRPVPQYGDYVENEWVRPRPQRPGGGARPWWCHAPCPSQVRFQRPKPRP